MLEPDLNSISLAHKRPLWGVCLCVSLQSGAVLLELSSWWLTGGEEEHGCVWRRLCHRSELLITLSSKKRWI